ncbi:CPCC family cysteine-rich protein [Pimelobacter simplex]|uniref:CPCC family cysteine-rich protein n=1 Tax=Nocardioides simplex TaxID=2045 RepID=UPI001933EE57|nr:hypothetical protein [Pimelobacter simplex]
MAETCPCCGYQTLPDRGAYDLCPVCWWEDDDAANDSASLDGPNGKTLAEGQRLYQRYGSSDLNGLRQVRQHAPGEPRDPNWVPQPRPDEDPRSELMRDTGWLLEVATWEALGLARRTHKEADIGRFRGLREALALVVAQADAFGFDRQDLGVDPRLNIERDLVLDPPQGSFAARD